MTLVSGVFIGISIYFLAPWMSTALLGQSYLTEAFRIGALILLLNTVGASQAGILTGFEAYRSIAFVNSIVGLLTVPLVAGGVYYYGVIGALWGMVGVSFMICVLYLIKVNSIMLRESIPRGKRPTHKESRLLLSFSLPAMLMGIMIGPVNWIGGTALVKMYGFSQMGLYSAANQWFSTLLFLPGVLTVVFLPIFSGSSGNESRNFQSIVTIGVKSTLLASLPLVCVVALASHLIMGFYGKEYQDAYPLLVVISFTAAVASTQNMFGNALAAVNRMWVNFFSNLLWASVYLGCAYALLLSGYGAIALCWASLAAYVFKLFFTVFFVVRIITNNNANKI
jgi:O-antigen/teichoic acid export membrane protein